MALLVDPLDFFFFLGFFATILGLVGWLLSSLIEEKYRHEKELVEVIVREVVRRCLEECRNA